MLLVFEHIAPKRINSNIKCITTQWHTYLYICSYNKYQHHCSNNAQNIVNILNLSFLHTFLYALCLFPHCFYTPPPNFQVHWFLSLILSFLLFTLGFICSPFSCFLMWKLRSFLWDFPFLMAVSVINFPLNTTLAASYKCWYAFLKFYSVQITS